MERPKSAERARKVWWTCKYYGHLPQFTYSWHFNSTGIPLSTYFSAIKLRWMLDHQKAVRIAHEADDLMFGTVDTWLVYVSSRVFQICTARRSCALLFLRT